MKKLNSIEMLRCFAALLVVLFHTQVISAVHTGHTPFGGLFSGGNHGVDLFFVLSGFIISYVHKSDLGKPARLTNYLFNRAARIYPAVWIMSSFALVLYMAGYGGASKAGKLAVYKVAASFLLLPQLSDALVNVTWTLKYEVFFYLIFSSLIINLRFGIVLLLTWQLLTLALSSFYSIHQLGVLGFYFTSLSLEFSIGIACTYALGFVGMQEWVQKQTILWPICFVGAAMFLLGMSTENRGGGYLAETTHLPITPGLLMFLAPSGQDCSSFHWCFWNAPVSCIYRKLS